MAKNKHLIEKREQSRNETKTIKLKKLPPDDRENKHLKIVFN